jgi:hypothetical protein
MIVVLLSASAAAADEKAIPEDALFCPSWAEAHEHSLASLNGGRAPYKVQWKGCVFLKKGAKVDLVDVDKTSGLQRDRLQRQALVYGRRSVLMARPHSVIPGLALREPGNHFSSHLGGSIDSGLARFTRAPE